MEEFSDLNLTDLSLLSDEVLQGFGERYAAEASRVLTTGLILPSDAQMLQLAVAITLGLYLKLLAENEIDTDRTIN